VNYYNDNDPLCCEWLRELIRRGLLPAGDVDERNIEHVTPADVEGYAQCHFFAGIGGWAYALKLAQVPDDIPGIWTGSCPYQPFSAIGKRRGIVDRRHLWPEFYRLIRECRPAIVFGEQVASAAGRKWLGAVFDDLAGMDYWCAGADLCAAGVGAPHIRQRLYWVARATRGDWRRVIHAAECECSCGEPDCHGECGMPLVCAGCGGEYDSCGCPGPSSEGWEFEDRYKEGLWARRRPEPALKSKLAGWVGNRNGAGLEGHAGHGDESPKPRRNAQKQAGHASPPSLLASPWDKAVFVLCKDGKARPVEPGILPLAHGIPARVGRIRALGNSVCPQVAQVFIEESLKAIMMME